MPSLSRYEILVVDDDSSVRDSVIADAYYAKGQSEPETLLGIVGDLVQSSAADAVEHKRESAPVWIPRNGKDSRGIPYVVLTCTDCLRSFPLSVATEDLQKIQETTCLFCPNTVRYIIDFSRSIVSHPSVKEEAAPMRAMRAAGNASRASAGPCGDSSLLRHISRR